MSKKNKEPHKWMLKIAKQHDISVETVKEYHDCLRDDIPESTRKKLTKEFFNLFFIGYKGE